jgi:hypothetical protein
MVNALAFQPFSSSSRPATVAAITSTATDTQPSPPPPTTTRGVTTRPSLYSNTSSSRRTFLTFVVAVTATTTTTTTTTVANARYILNEETGDYEEVQDKEWQTEWKERLDKAQTMSTDDVFLAARGAKNRVEGMEESEASKKRRAMAGCRDTGLLTKSGLTDVKECTARVLQGDVDFMLQVM